jgi:superfamily II DNA or RNA helicase
MRGSGNMETTMAPKRKVNVPELKFLDSLDENKIYLDNWLYIPKKTLPMMDGIRKILTLTSTTSLPEGFTGRTVKAYEDLEHHLAVPRAFMSYKRVERLKAELVDTRNLQKGDAWSCSIEPRDEIQKQVIKSLSRNHSGGLLELSCGTGKTPMGLHFAASRGVPCIVIVNTTALLLQWKEEAERFLDKEVGIIQRKKREIKDISIAMIHTLAANPLTEEEADFFGTIIFDECHRLASPTFNSVCPRFRGLRLGLTATRKRDDGLESLYQHHLGPILHSNLTTQVTPDVEFLQTGFKVSPEDWNDLLVNGLVNSAKLKSYLSTISGRDDLIIKRVLELKREGRKILVLGSVVEHLETLCSRVPEAGLFIGKVKPQERDRVLKNCPVVFATTHLAAEGLNEKSLDTLVVTSTFKSNRLIQQSLGRIQRLCDGKKKPLALFFIDDVPQIKGHMKYIKSWMKENEIPFKTKRNR